MSPVSDPSEIRQVNELALILAFLAARLGALAVCLVLGIGSGVAFERMKAKYHHGSVSIFIGSVGVVGQKIPKAEEIPGGDSEIISGVRYYGLEPGRRLLMTASELYRVVSAKYAISSAVKGELPLPYIYNIDNLSGDGIKIFARGESPEQTRAFLNEVASDILDKHQAIFAPAQGSLRELLKTLDKKRAEVSEREGGDGLARLVALSELIYEVERALSPINSQPSRLVGSIKIEPRQPPKDVLAGVIGGILGLAIGALLLLAIDFTKLHKMRLRSKDL